jgi:hypothetical protein
MKFLLEIMKPVPSANIMVSDKEFILTGKSLMNVTNSAGLTIDTWGTP